MKTLMADPGLRQRLKQEGPRQAARFSWKTMAEQVLAIYQETVHEQSLRLHYSV